MTTLELSFPTTDPAEQLITLAGEMGLRLATMPALKTYPGCAHWHLQHPSKSGTIELTWWPKGQRFWIKIASNRSAEWTEGAAESICHAFGRAIT